MERDFSRVRLCVLVSSGLSELPPAKLAAEAAAGGADCIQLREKDISDRALLDVAKACRDACRDVLFIVNDRADVAVLSGADGVHVGQEDLPAAQARRIVGEEMLVGVSVSRIEHIGPAERQGADYLGVGCVFPTATKEVEVAGLEFLRAAAQEARLPVLAVGGINADNAPLAIAAGAVGVAVCSAVIGAGDVRGAARAVRDAVLRASS